MKKNEIKINNFGINNHYLSERVFLSSKCNLFAEIESKILLKTCWFALCTTHKQLVVSFMFVISTYSQEAYFAYAPPIEYAFRSWSAFFPLYLCIYTYIYTYVQPRTRHSNAVCTMSSLFHVSLFGFFCVCSTQNAYVNNKPAMNSIWPGRATCGRRFCYSVEIKHFVIRQTYSKVNFMQFKELQFNVISKHVEK